MVARQQEDRLHRQLPHALLDRPAKRAPSSASPPSRSTGRDEPRGPAYAWSPDSKWLAYSLTNRAGFQQVWLYSLDNDKSTSVTDGLAEAGEPVFDQGGKYLYFLASTDAGPVNNWFDQSNTDMQATATIYLVTLAKATANPLLKESDEEGAG